MPPETYTYEWQSGDRRLRLDRVLAKKWEVSRTQLQEWIREGRLQGDGSEVPIKHVPEVGEELVLEVPEPEPSEVEPREMNLNVLYEDDDIVVLNKRAGDVVHPGAGVRGETLVAGLLHHCRGSLSGVGGVERPGIVHRLDRDTSGVLIVAKQDEAHRHLSSQFQNRTTEKTYHAWVLGIPRGMKGEWDGPIGRHPVNRKKMAVVKERGREARTGYEVLEAHPRASFLEVRLYTGRTHQIRVHASEAHCPVVGDEMYGGVPEWVRRYGVARQLLHASRLVVVHPSTNKTIEFQAPLPEDFHDFAGKPGLSDES